MISNSNKLVSVVMPVFNCEDFVKEAIESILNQTYREFELIVINDGSTDGSDVLIREFNDPRIKYINNSPNKGIVSTINEGVSRSKGKYIARMDADDISLPTRLAKQVDFLETNPDVKLCGTRAIAIDKNGRQLVKLNRPLKHDKIKVFNLFRNAFIHPTIMADANALKKIGFTEDYKYAEDYFTFSQFTMQYQVANLEWPLLLYRLHDESITAKKNKEMMASELKTMRYLLSFLFKTIELKIVQLHHALLRAPAYPFSAEEIHNHLLQIFEANRAKNIFDQQTLVKQLQKEWFNYLYQNKTSNALRKYLSSPLVNVKNFVPKYFFKLIFRSL